MTIALWIVGSIVVLILLAVLVLHLIGRAIPEEHMAASVVSIPAPPEQVYAAIDDIAKQPEWAGGVTKVVMLPEKSGLQQCRMHMGRNKFVLTRTRHEPARIIERTIEDDCGPFTGTWTYTFAPAIVNGKEGCQVKLTEVGRVSQAIPRTVMKHMIGYHSYINKHLLSLGKKFGVTVEPRKA